MARIDDLQARANGLLGTQASSAQAVTQALVEVEPGPPFSPFIPSQLDQAVEVTELLMQAADAASGEDAIEAALDEARRLASERPPQLVQHALQLFIVHHPDGSQLSIPPIQPMTDEDRRPAFTADQEETDLETRVDYFREDLMANEHHRHWHDVYPGRGIGGRLQDRQGELFFYMHQQMLARYDAERLSLGLDPVVAFTDYRSPIGQGYGNRPPDQRLVDVDRVDEDPRTGQRWQTQISVADLEAQRDPIFAAVKRGDFRRATLIESMNALGAAEEPQGRSQGWHHGAGHVICSWIMNPGGGGEMALIGSTRTAIRDPFFWRWHRHVDDLGVALQDQFGEHTFNDAPPVVVRSDDDASGGDLILCFEDQLPASARANDAQAREWAEETFGGDRFDQPPEPERSTDELETRMTETPFDPGDPQTVPVAHLTHQPFCVIARLRSTATERHRVTIRIFLAPERSADDRRSWIELDKFDAWLEGSERAVLCRPMRLSSVARKPTTPEPQFIQPPAQTRREQYCRCGWPYHLLLPRGTEDGLRFRLAVIVTDFAADHLHGDPHCGSLSFCGAMDEAFPDRREMGYPFNRPFRSRTIAATLAAHNTIAVRSLSVRHT